MILEMKKYKLTGNVKEIIAFIVEYEKSCEYRTTILDITDMKTYLKEKER